jgi:hypothetical protein
VETNSLPGADADVIAELPVLLRESRASAEFKEAVRRFEQEGRADRIEIRGRAPRVKVLRVLKHVLASEPELPIEHVTIEGQSGCSDFAGTVQLVANSAQRAFDFVWCCRWRAEEQGWTDYFGLPDQMRAAQEYDWRCFQVWQERTASL